MQRYRVDPQKLMKRGYKMLTNAAYLKSNPIQINVTQQVLYKIELYLLA